MSWKGILSSKEIYPMGISYQESLVSPKNIDIHIHIYVYILAKSIYLLRIIVCVIRSFAKTPFNLIKQST